MDTGPPAIGLGVDSPIATPGADGPLIRGIEPGERISCYSAELAYYLFDGVIRLNGLPTFDDHLARVASYFQYITKPSRYQGAGLGGCWMHDGVEDTRKLMHKIVLDVYNPFMYTPTKRLGRIIHEFNPFKGFPETKPGVVYLNNLVAPAKDDGLALCYIMFLMTHRPGINYQQYVHNIFTLPEDKLLATFHILTQLVKICDRRTNTNPNEVENEKQRYRALSTALDNITQYCPLAEQILVMGPAKDSGLYDVAKVRALIKEIYEDSIMMCKKYPITLEVAAKVGMNRDAPTVAGYVHMIEEIKKEGLAFPKPRITVLVEGVGRKDVANSTPCGAPKYKI